jgi:DNA-binding transcriptional LysR family regulator
VAEEGSMTRAARLLTMTQQAISGQIRQLERIVGTPLVHRLPTGVELTEAGQIVLKQGRALMAATSSMVSEARLIGLGHSGRLRIAFKAHSTGHFMPEIEAALRHEAPDLEVEPIAMYTLLDELKAVSDGSVDAGFVWLPIGDDPDMATYPLMSESRLVALRPGHPLSSRSSLRIADLANEPVVGPRDGMPPAVVQAWFIDPRPDGTRAVYGPQGRTPAECLHFVAAGHGCWIAPASVATYFTYPQVVWLPLEDADPLELALIWPRRSANPLLQQLLLASRRIIQATAS